MCEQCGQCASAAKVSVKRRQKLWEINANLHCPILGTCLTLDELRKVVRQSNVEMCGNPSDYELHATLVAQSSERGGRIAKNLHKMLDRKYKRWVQFLASCTSDDELEWHWQAALKTGEIAGTFWAIVTHPHASWDLIWKTYGDVHMLSHLQGASNRTDIKRLKALEEEVTELRQALEKNWQNHQEQIALRDARFQKQEQELRLVRENHAQPFFPPQEGEELKEMEELRKHNQMLRMRLERTEGQLIQREEEVSRLETEMDALHQSFNEVQDEHAAVEMAMERLLSDHKAEGLEPGREIDLGGKRVLYVGGRTTLAPHLRSLVEAHNGRFDHHDGGVEDSRAGLHCALAGVDMVFCPMDCISHDACNRVKKYCKQQAKPFIPLRSAGLSSLAAGLRQLAGTGDGEVRNEGQVGSEGLLQ